MRNIIIHKQPYSDTFLVVIERQGVTESFITVSPAPGENLSSVIRRLKGLLEEQDARVVKFDVFGSIGEFDTLLSSLKNVFGHVDWPITWVEGISCFIHPVAGFHVHAVSGVAVETIFLDESPAARVFDDDFSRYCVLGNVFPVPTSASREEQTWNAFITLETLLSRAGMDLSNIVRTWFYNENILEWYDQFNVMRDSFFKKRGIFKRLLPASTGVGGNNQYKAALIASTVAIRARGNNVRVQEVVSPGQCPAPDYGSAFSRAVEIAMPDHRVVLISGTASIDTGGQTVYPHDINAQVAHTMEVVESILESRGLDYSNITRAFAYFKRGQDAPALYRYWKNKGKPPMPVIIMQNDLCRDNLLFEIEVDGVSLE